MALLSWRCIARIRVLGGGRRCSSCSEAFWLSASGVFRLWGTVSGDTRLCVHGAVQTWPSLGWKPQLTRPHSGQDQHGCCCWRGSRIPIPHTSPTPSAQFSGFNMLVELCERPTIYFGAFLYSVTGIRDQSPHFSPLPRQPPVCLLSLRICPFVRVTCVPSFCTRGLSSELISLGAVFPSLVHEAAYVCQCSVLFTAE